MNEQFVLLWLPLVLVLVLVLEHFLLTRRYGKQSSLQRLRAWGNSARADSLLSFMFYVGWPYVESVAKVLTVPGLALVTAQLWAGFGWPSLLGRWMPANPIAIFVIWLLAVDFATYLSHVLLHKVPWLWHLHRLHHSATEFNIITGNRLSFAERFFNDFLIMLFLALVLGLPSPQLIFSVMFVYNVIDLLQHSDLPWDYGILDFLIASPRYHRIHHSMHSEDANANYGNIFSLWDYLFGTVAARYRQSKAIADTCVLGLQDRAETASINDRWYLAPFLATGLDYLLSWVRSEADAKSGSERAFLRAEADPE
jgi:sterol desaturase/sphingolipid hydroxylase (fatty acid hydroxylase superfamily)